MNYRHAYHAGNFADCMKHALLVWLLEALQQKPAPIFVLDTHAGAGLYDLDTGPAQRTGEFHHGIGRLLQQTPPALAAYIGLVRKLHRGGLHYPGSPLLLRTMLRDNDRLVCCELHPDEVFELRRRFARDKHVAVHHRDGWEALGGLLPPRERRALVLIDPSFESPREFEDLVSGLAAGYARFRTGVFAAWYPIKHRAPVRKFLSMVQQTGIRDVLTAELYLREPLDPDRLNGCGLLLVNPPFRFEEEALKILTALRDSLARGERGAAASVTRIADE
ncbi:MAG: 23S rRNA (adenine(2030)-N(6))-methyltransferase RlmJ [Acetobacteraceae bacterium]|nr:23S rRNA (adenine(2030)-N(6))-methyltransferase RlmJ [Acetobacteraceae bacterium]